MGKATKAERRQVIEWLKESEENMSKYASMKAKYVFFGLPNEILPERKRRIPKTFVYAAAALAVPLLAGVIFLTVSRSKVSNQYKDAERRIALMVDQSSKDVTYIANPGTKSVVVLPDSSVVHLNSDSKLVVPSTFNPDCREVFLSGEGYFEVTHHEDWPMHVQTPGGVEVKVLGTTFNLSAYNNDPDVKLTLIEGKVKVKKDKDSAELELKPNQEVKIANASSDVTVSSSEAVPSKPEVKKADIHKSTAWVSGELVFDNTPMPDIVRQLERWYGVKFHIMDQEVMKSRLTASFTTESITRVMELMKFSSTLDYEIIGSDIYIRKIS